MNDKLKYLGVDLGAESGRCIVAHFDGAKVSLNEVHRFKTYNYIKDYSFHWDINRIFNEIITGFSKAVKMYGSKFESIGVDTWGVDYALLDSENNLLNDPFHYRDGRTDTIVSDVFAEISREELFNLTGIQTQKFNTIFQLFQEFRHNSNHIAKANTFLFIPDYLNFLLCGVLSSDYTIASTSGLTDPEKRDWNWGIIYKLKFNKDIFPDIVEPGQPIGSLLSEVCDATGISKNTPVIASAGHDTASAVVSVPASNEEWAFLSSGTWSIMGVELTKPVINEQTRKYNFSNEGGFEGTIRLLKNIIGLWPIQECRRFWKNNGLDYSYDELTKIAIDYGNANCWIDLNDSRFQKPGNFPNKINDFLLETNQKVNNDIGFIIRLIIESLAFSYKIVLKEIEEITGHKISVLNAVGGGIQNELLCQLTADALNLPVLAGPVEGTIIGNIGVQSIATEAVSGMKSWRNIVSNSFELKTYNPENVEYFNANEIIFKQICKNYG